MTGPFHSARSVVILVVAVLLDAGLPATSDGAGKSRVQGESLFSGRAPLTARVRGHQSSLPPETVRCRNCHAAGNRPSSPKAIAPRIDRSLLLAPQPRRGGPPSSYDEAAFCRLLRTGVDPAYVLIARAMPAYDLDDTQCGSLWRFLTAK